MKNQKTILEERNKVTNGYRNYMYKFNFNNPNHTEVLTNNVFVDEDSGELIINSHLINNLIEQGYEYEMQEGSFKSIVLPPECDKHRLEVNFVKRVLPEYWEI